MIDNILLKENQEDTDTNNAKRVKREKRSERVIQKDFRGLRRTCCTGTDLKQRLFSKDVMYHGSRVPPSAMEKSHQAIEANERHNEEAAQFIEQKQIEQRPPRQCMFHIQPLPGHQAR